MQLQSLMINTFTIAKYFNIVIVSSIDHQCLRENNNSYIILLFEYFEYMMYQNYEITVVRQTVLRTVRSIQMAGGVGGGLTH